ncbi:efflux RND transporter periplasmic adaptor subunit [Actinomadura alba]|nr:HlyD family efflux transporter periplasmic adaptor subunit [Actinomadura alba]
MRRFTPLAVVGVLIAGLISACSGDDETAGIRLAAVSRADVAEVVEAPATVTARATATLRSPAEGTVRRLRVADGDEVRKGEVLARIASPAAEEQLRQAREADRGVSGGGAVPAGVELGSFQRRTDRTARSGFTAARRVAMKIPDTRQRALVLAQITKAQADYATAAAAAHNALVQLDSGLGSVRQAMASIAAAQQVQTRAAVRAAERVAAGLTIKAPFAGVASLGGPAGGAGDLSGLLGGLPPQAQAQAGGAVPSLTGGGGAAKDAASVAEGAPIASGDAVVTVTDVSRLGLSAEVDETDVLDVKRGTPATVEFDAVQGATYRAEVTGVGVTPKESTGGGVTYRVTLSLRRGTTADGTAAPWPKPGMSAVVDLRVREVGSAVSVPSSAIVTSGRDSTVWVVSGGRAQRRVVRLGAQGDTTVQVVSGVTEGERVVVRGVNAVKQGQELH